MRDPSRSTAFASTPVGRFGMTNEGLFSPRYVPDSSPAPAPQLGKPGNHISEINGICDQKITFQSKK
ncbi:MAG: hypothetical protein WD016_02010 [Balneolaceae bacterium]